MGALFFDSSAKAGLPFSPLMFTTTGFLDVSSDFVTSDGTVTLSSVYGFSVATCIGALTLEAVSAKATCKDKCERIKQRTRVREDESLMFALFIETK